MLIQTGGTGGICAQIVALLALLGISTENTYTCVWSLIIVIIETRMREINVLIIISKLITRRFGIFSQDSS